MIAKHDFELDLLLVKSEINKEESGKYISVELEAKVIDVASEDTEYISRGVFLQFTSVNHNLLTTYLNEVFFCRVSKDMIIDLDMIEIGSVGTFELLVLPSDNYEYFKLINIINLKIEQ